ncbi:putative cysteine-rich receptor-like protein kinase 30 [Raphanus sativus]|uniref:Cysteine-rich receptor-like protein kinase 30 isoform X1 n=1 Tax=Raphanus sativus TaxID=3726 RepID=A0A9W3CTD0_RAPSA|nr:putative cysteine-rich receptor-like protein kinase 30 isoform X1 [Raphanus sativus]XP_056854792.1 putative cysteine-rich receptor-like protein kinase 30 isoform X1 [Raphanus sativus]KAJ4869644.1 putative cysteine-rich receptor-like protein kinase 30 [Raphanus sativus]KAJ4910089.1 putative cysteine-rich receptor-like protein kinase 30 [Raphanus sativus]
MGQNNLLSLALWLLPVSLTVVVSAQVCLENFGTFRPGGTFDRNRQLILSSLASEVAAKDGFFNVSVGTYPDQVYALGMCIPGAKQEFCSDCIKAASDQLIQSCPNQAAAFYWSGGGETLCMARYSNSPSFRPVDTDSPSYGANVENLSTNLTDFDRFLERLAVRMVTAALSSSGKNVPFSNSRFYAADVAALTSSINVYALMQCTPDVSPSNCKTCLRQSVDYYIDCCRGEQGGYVYWPNCLFRLDMYPYNGAFSPLKLAPQPTSQPAFQPASQPAFQPASQPATQPASQLQSPPPLTNEDGKTIDKGAIIGIVAAMLIINM